MFSSPTVKYKDIEFSGRVPPKISRRITDHEYELIPRGIYNDHISELQLRQEGKSGKAIQERIYDLLLLNDIDVQNSLHFLSRAPVIDEGVDGEVKDNGSNQNLDNEERIVILTDWGIDILNYKQIDALQPIPKTKIASPAERPVHSTTLKNIVQPFGATFRYGSVLNNLACTDKETIQFCHDKCKEREKVIIENDRKSSLRYPKKFVPNEMTIRSRGLSYRARGVLDARLGWSKAIPSEENILGDITDNVIGSGKVSFTNDIQIGTTIFSRKSSIPARPVIDTYADAVFLEKGEGIMSKIRDSPTSVFKEIEISGENDTVVVLTSNSTEIDKISSEMKNEDVATNQDTLRINPEEMHISVPALAASSVDSPTVVKEEPGLSSAKNTVDENVDDEEWIKEERKKMFKGWRNDSEQKDIAVVEDNTVKVEIKKEIAKPELSRFEKMVQKANEASESKFQSRLEKMIQKNVQAEVKLETNCVTPEEHRIPVQKMEKLQKGDLDLPPLPAKEIPSFLGKDISKASPTHVSVASDAAAPLEEIPLAIPDQSKNITSNEPLITPILTKNENARIPGHHSQKSELELERTVAEVVSVLQEPEHADSPIGSVRGRADEHKISGLKKLKNWATSSVNPKEVVNSQEYLDKVDTRKKGFGSVAGALFRSKSKSSLQTGEQKDDNAETAEPETPAKRISLVEKGKDLVDNSQSDYSKHGENEKKSTVLNRKSFFGRKSKSKSNITDQDPEEQDTPISRTSIAAKEIKDEHDAKKSGVLNRKSFFSGKSKSKSNINEESVEVQQSSENKSAHEAEVEKKTGGLNRKSFFGIKSKSKTNLSELEPGNEDAAVNRRSVVGEKNIQDVEPIDPKKPGIFHRKSFFGGKSKSKSDLNETQAKYGESKLSTSIEAQKLSERETKESSETDAKSSNALKPKSKTSMIESKVEDEIENTKGRQIADITKQGDYNLSKQTSEFEISASSQRYTPEHDAVRSDDSKIPVPHQTALSPSIGSKRAVASSEASSTIADTRVSENADTEPELSLLTENPLYDVPSRATPIEIIAVKAVANLPVSVERGFSAMSHKAILVGSGKASVESIQVQHDDGSSQNFEQPKSKPGGKFLSAMDLAAIQSRRVPEIDGSNNNTNDLNNAEKAADIANVGKSTTSSNTQNFLKDAPKADFNSAPKPNLSDQKLQNSESDSEKILALPVKVTWKDHKCEVRITNFELHCNEEGKTKPYKPYLPISLRQIISLSVEKSSQVLITCVIHPQGELTGKEFKTILLIFNNAPAAQQWRDHMVNLTFGGGYEEFLKKEILILVEKSDKDSQKMVDKYVTEVLRGSKRPFKVEITQFNEFSVANLLEKQNFKNLGIIHVTNPEFAPRLQQLLVRDRHCLQSANYMVEKDPVDCALDIVRCKLKFNAAAVGKKNQGILQISGVQFKKESGEKGVFGMFKK